MVEGSDFSLKQNLVVLNVIAFFLSVVSFWVFGTAYLDLLAPNHYEGLVIFMITTMIVNEVLLCLVFYNMSAAMIVE